MELWKVFAKSFVLACVAVVLLSLTDNTHAACSGNGTAWTWDDSENKSCAPCNFSGQLNYSTQKKPAFCSGSGSSTSTTQYYGLRVKFPTQAESISLTYWVDGNEQTPIKTSAQSVDFIFTEWGLLRGQRFCAAYQTINGGTWSVRSVQACISIPGVAGSSAPSAPTGQPAVPIIELIK